MLSNDIDFLLSPKHLAAGGAGVPVGNMSSTVPETEGRGTLQPLWCCWWLAGSLLALLTLQLRPEAGVGWGKKRPHEVFPREAAGL